MTFEEVLRTTGRLVYTNVGVSMMPLIREGRDVMIIEKLTAPLRKNDAVLFIRPGVSGRGKYVLHRIRRINGDGTYYIVGDNCIDGETVEESAIIGILTQVKRGDKVIHCTDLGYLMYVKFWWLIYPLRVLWKKCRRFAGRCKRKLKG